MGKNRGLNFSDLSTYKGELYGFCAVWIMVFHCYLCGIGYDGGNPFAQAAWTVINRGNMGVDIFLALSGVFLYFAYSGHEGDLGRFVKRRVVRLMLPVLLIYGGYWIWEMIQTRDGYTLLLRITTLEFWVTGRQKIWFVSFILVCYLLYPYIYTFLKGSRRRYTAKAMALMAAVMVLTYTCRESGGSFYKTYEIALTRLPMFLLGCWAGRFVKEKAPLPRWVVPLAYVSVAVWVYVYTWGTPPKSIWGRYFYIFTGTGALLVLTHLFKRIRWNPLHRLFRFFGTISLECYLGNILLITLYKLTPFYAKGSILGYALLLAVDVAVAAAASKLGEVIRRRLAA